ncbi:MAG: hypothetical protein F6K17_14310 [Okeania sp. SIO3C4]|nr:hypothetical protein [Okeania sp. SIO3C4]
MAVPNNWEKQILEKISDIHKATLISGGVGSGEIFEQANIDLHEFTPNKDLDQKQRVYLAGPEWSIIQQSSLLKAGHDILGDRLGFTIDFEKWFEDFEYEFQRHLPSTKKPATSKLKPWGKEIANRPKKLNLLTKEEARKRGYMVIRFWKDRTIEDDAQTLAGTYTSLIWQLPMIMRAQEVIADAVPEKEAPIVAGHPLVSLHFSARSKLPGKSTPTRLQISWRLMNKVEHIDYRWAGESVLSTADVQQLKSKIIAKFKNYIVKRGDIIYSYTFRPLGYSFWQPLVNREEAIRLYSDVLSIQGHILKQELIKDGSKKIKKATIAPKKKIILGKEVLIHTAFTKEDLYFRYARLYLPISKQSQTLVSL